MTIQDWARQVLDRLDRLGSLLHNDNVAPILGPDIQANFHGSHDPSGAPWAPLSPITIAKTRGFGLRTGRRRIKPLIFTGELRAANKYMTDLVDVAASGNRAYLILNTTLLPFYWKFHDTGTWNMPQRQFIGLSDPGAEKIAEVVASEFIKSL